MTSITKRARIILLSLLIISVGVSSLYCYFDSTINKNKKEASTATKKDSNNNEEVTLSKGFVAVMPLLQFDLIKDFYLVLKFDFLEKEEKIFEGIYIPYTGKYFRTLFCFVISPNAP